jgi:hypothetical protein
VRAFHHHLESKDMKELRFSLMAVPLLFTAACADIRCEDGAQNAPPLCRQPSHPPTKATSASPSGSSSKPACGDEGAAHGQLWDGTGRSEAVRGA